MFYILQMKKNIFEAQRYKKLVEIWKKFCNFAEIFEYSKN